MACWRCENPDEDARVATRGESFRAIGKVRRAVFRGDIVEIDAGPVKGMSEFSDLSEAGLLDEILLCRLRRPDCEQNFVLGAETCHGSGEHFEIALKGSDGLRLALDRPLRKTPTVRA